MKTMNLATRSKNLVIVSILLLCTSSIQAQYAFDNAILASNYARKASKSTEVSITVETSNLKQFTVDESVADIKNWINTEMSKAIVKSHLEECRITTTVNLELDKNGKITYNIKDINCRIGQLLDNVLKNAPSFHPVTLNGYARRMHYLLPVTVVVR
jgi:hypothetical protein